MKEHFTKLLKEQVDELECVEASSNAVAARKSDPELQDIKFHNDVENVNLPHKYKNGNLDTCSRALG